ncbi:S-adenosyl-L-methionine-dependent methyltransferase [Xylariaceae sp. AK1471]|nr:S-adenosyl-L-methionine-dependent methyltransferase [Xylariaceae sp. AK1471]
MANNTRKGIPIAQDLAPKIASYFLQGPGHPEIEIAQAEHRIRLVNLWDLKSGTRVLELGCGQGNTTAVLAEVLGPSGHVDAVDPGAPDYGAPFTLSQSQNHLSASPIGSRITWHHVTPQAFLAGTNSVWDVAVLSHCIWYFASEQELDEVLKALQGRVKRLWIAEYALHATEKAAIPHVLAVLARGSLESCKEESSENVRSVLSPSAIKEAAKKSHWACTQENTVVPHFDLLDGSWEVGTVMSDHFLREVDKAVLSERMRAVIRSARDATIAAVSTLNGVNVQTMDVWVAVFTPSASS